MIFYLKHPRHGTKVATLQLEVDADIANGWEIFDPDEKQEDVPDFLNTDQNMMRKRGRPVKSI